MTSKRIILGVGVLAAVGVVFAFWSGLVPPKNGLEGTIGAAQRYQSGQISDKDVVMQDQELQALLQSDVFHKLQTDPAYQVGFRTIVASKAFGEAARTGNYIDLDKRVQEELAARSTMIEDARAQSVEAENRVKALEKRSLVDRSVTVTDISNARGQAEQAKRNLEEMQKSSIAGRTAIDVANARAQVTEAEKRVQVAEKRSSVDKSAAASDISNARAQVEAAKRNLEQAQRAQELGKTANVAQVRSVVDSDAFKTMVAQNRNTLTLLARTPVGLEKLVQETNRTAVAETQKASQAGN